jgi:peptide/nickel transport system permease protein
MTMDITALALSEGAGDETEDDDGRRGFKRFRRGKGNLIACAVIIIAVFLALFGPYIAPYGLEQTSGSYLASPSLAHLLGTDGIGHDELSQLLFAMRSSMFGAVLAVAIGTSLGTLIGLASGYLGGRADWGIMRLIDALMSFPGLLLIIAVIGILGTGFYKAMIALSISFIPGFARLVRGEVLAAREQGYVAAAQVTGASSFRIIRKHIVPTIFPSFIVQVCLTLGLALIAEGALGFLGLGSQPPQTSLGQMVQSGFSKLNETVWPVLIPGLVITVLALSFNVIADGIRDSLGRDVEAVGLTTGPKA